MTGLKTPRPGLDAWQILRDSIAVGGLSMAQESHTPGFMTSCFVDAPELGHYLGYLCPTPAGLAFFEEVPGH